MTISSSLLDDGDVDAHDARHRLRQLAEGSTPPESADGTDVVYLAAVLLETMEPSEASAEAARICDLIAQVEAHAGDHLAVDDIHSAEAFAAVLAMQIDRPSLEGILKRARQASTRVQTARRKRLFDTTSVPTVSIVANPVSEASKAVEQPLSSPPAADRQPAGPVGAEHQLPSTPDPEAILLGGPLPNWQALPGPTRSEGSLLRPELVALPVGVLAGVGALPSGNLLGAVIGLFTGFAWIAASYLIRQSIKRELQAQT